MVTKSPNVVLLIFQDFPPDAFNRKKSSNFSCFNNSFALSFVASGYGNPSKSSGFLKKLSVLNKEEMSK